MAESDRLVFSLQPVFNLFGNGDEMSMSFVVRKTAHFLEYAVLAMLGKEMTDAWLGDSRASWIAFAAIWILVPCADETIQLLVPGRTGQLRDVLIDMAGGLFGLLVLLLDRRRTPRGRRGSS